MADSPAPVHVTDSWEQILDGLAAHVATLRSAAADESMLLELPVAQWLPPEGLGAIPEGLASRAAALLSQMQDLAPLLEQRREATMKQLRAVDSVPRDTGQSAIYLDSIG
ncbi:hypothetical protein DQ353_07715 [Arthrobacter sp. AQ5-05]|uniref:hypothetical protein n=1 Tax=Arthrobacter sp. AQ5-05 TaxID=2184581 RepID=UPI000DCB15FC|nr:hypothetical protein [Arthrobacter sp. AQ5-05]RAX49708.1 hypothetical protein DQ353_07715 [Arthrobacter sp. AQ5-05]